MRIGLDLDNTIINYDLAFISAANSLGVNLPEFCITKTKIKNFVRALDQGDILWQRLQGKVYSKFIETHGQLYSGVKRFLLHSKLSGHEIVIVSHKTINAHYDDCELPIRELATQFLIDNGLIGGSYPLVSSVYYESTREEKIKKILSLDFDWFVDDLPEVLKQLESVNSVAKIYFNSSVDSHFIPVSKDDEKYFEVYSWQKIDDLINGQWTALQICMLANLMVGENFHSAERVVSGKNSAVFKVNRVSGDSVRIKLYPDDYVHNRLFSEAFAFSAINKFDLGSVPLVIGTDKSLGLGIYEWVEGTAILDRGIDDISSCLNFLRTLHSAKDDPAFLGAPNASAACFSLGDAIGQLKTRLFQFSIARASSPSLNDFLVGRFIPAMNKLISNVESNFSRDKSIGKALLGSGRTLSPSDFGFHNAIRKDDGSLCFVDFEYFGWDDPAKLITDFSFHPGMNLSDLEVKFWLEGSLSIYGNACFLRLKAIWPIYALIWCLILLNEFRLDLIDRRLHSGAFGDTKLENFQLMQLEKSQNLLGKIESNDFGVLLNMVLK